MNVKLKALVVTPILAVTMALTACNSTPSEPVNVQDRQDVMKNWKDSNGVIKDMLASPDKFDKEALLSEANFLNDHGDVWSKFDNKEELGNAQEAIWSNPEEWQSKINDFREATQALSIAAVDASSVEDIQAQAKAVGESCGSCHDVFKN